VVVLLPFRQIHQSETIPVFMVIYGLGLNDGSNTLRFYEKATDHEPCEVVHRLLCGGSVEHSAATKELECRLEGSWSMVALVKSSRQLHHLRTSERPCVLSLLRCRGRESLLSSYRRASRLERDATRSISARADSGSRTFRGCNFRSEQFFPKTAYIIKLS